MSWVMLESSSLAFFEIHEPPTFKLLTFVSAFSISLFFFPLNFKISLSHTQSSFVWVQATESTYCLRLTGFIYRDTRQDIGRHVCVSVLSK